MTTKRIIGINFPMAKKLLTAADLRIPMRLIMVRDTTIPVINMGFQVEEVAAGQKKQNRLPEDYILPRKLLPW